MLQPKPTSQPKAPRALKRHDGQTASISAPVVAPADPMAYVGSRIDPERRRGRGDSIIKRHSEKATWPLPPFYAPT